MSHLFFIGYLIGYVALHSLLASQPCKAWVARRVGSPGVRWYRLGYNVVAVVTLLPLPVLLLLVPDQVLYEVQAPWSWLLVAGQALAAFGLIDAMWQTSPGHFLGISQVRTSRPDPFVDRGYYAYVRHPVYLFGMFWLWLSPTMTMNLLIVYGLFTLYMYIGSFHEEQRLLREFGDDYRIYQQRVGRFLPRLRQPASHSTTCSESSEYE